MEKGLLEVIPILEGNLNACREEIHKQIIYTALNSLDKQKIKIQEISSRIKDLFGINYPEEMIAHQLKKSGLYEIKLENNIVTLTDKIPTQDNNINSVIDNLFNEFIGNYTKEYDIYLNKNLKDAFIKCFEQIVGFIIKSQEINEINLDTIDLKSNEEILKKILIEFKVTKPDKFRSKLYDFLLSDSKNKDKFVLSVHQYAISLDLLNRSSDLYTYSRDYPDKGILLIDTNIITSVLCKSNRFHDTIVSMLSLSKRFGFDIHYSRETKNELLRLIDSADIMMRTKSATKHERNNELVTDYLRDTSKPNWTEKLIFYNSFENILRTKFDITLLLDPGFEEDNDLSDYIMQVYDIAICYERELPVKSAIDHDAYLLNLMNYHKHSEGSRQFGSPWIISLHNRFIFVSDYIKTKKSLDYGFVIHAQKWFNLLMEFCDIEDIRGNENLLTSAIIKYSIIPPKDSLTLDEYCKLLANKMGLEGAEAEYVLDIITKSKLKSDLEKSLETNDAENITNKTYEIFANVPAMDKFIAQRESEKGKDRIIQGLKDFQKQLIHEKEISEAERDTYKKMLPPAGMVGNTYNISDVSGQIFLGNFNNVIAQLNSKGLKELAGVLTDGREALMSKADLGMEQKQELIEVLEKIGEESIKAKPNRTILMGLNEGLKSVSGVIPKVIKTVNEIIRA